MPKKAMVRLPLLLVGIGLYPGGHDVDSGKLEAQFSAVFQATKAHGWNKFPEQ